jgi:DNA-binding MarR family transcriptional regulator
MNSIERLVYELEDLLNTAHSMEELSRPAKGELFILRYLSDKKSPVSPSEISDALGSSNARISKALGTLEKKGQIRREINLSNRRFILVSITDDGRNRVETTMRLMRSHLSEVLAEMGERDAESFVCLLKKFFEIMARTMPTDIMVENRPPGG